MYVILSTYHSFATQLYCGMPHVLLCQCTMTAPLYPIIVYVITCSCHRDESPCYSPPPPPPTSCPAPSVNPDPHTPPPRTPQPLIILCSRYSTKHIQHRHTQGHSRSSVAQGRNRHGAAFEWRGQQTSLAAYDLYYYLCHYCRPIVPTYLRYLCTDHTVTH